MPGVTPGTIIRVGDAEAVLCDAKVVGALGMLLEPANCQGTGLLVVAGRLLASCNPGRPGEANAPTVGPCCGRPTRPNVVGMAGIEDTAAGIGMPGAPHACGGCCLLHAGISRGVPARGAAKCCSVGVVALADNRGVGLSSLGGVDPTLDAACMMPGGNWQLPKPPA